MDPTKWPVDELRRNREVAENRFILERKGEGPDAFYASWDQSEALVRRALELTNDLQDVRGSALVAEPKLWQTLRYVCAPPISEEDLWTLAGQKFKVSLRPAVAEATARVLTSLLDSRRFPWVASQRRPTSPEREAAVLATAVLLAHETLRTSRRGKSSRKQEDEVSEVLRAAGMTLNKGRRAILRLDELPRGEFSRERKVDGAKCDVPIRLPDGRLLALECKVSNGPKNSWKRLQREVGGKAERWREEFGSQVVTGAVLAGVFDLSCLLAAQNQQNVYLFWQHDLAPLTEFVASAR